MQYSLNHMVAPRLAHPEFFDLTKRLGLNWVEIRNDLQGVALVDSNSKCLPLRDFRPRFVWQFPEVVLI